jgi:hypothetical protein
MHTYSPLERSCPLKANDKYISFSQFELCWWLSPSMGTKTSVNPMAGSELAPHRGGCFLEMPSEAMRIDVRVLLMLRISNIGLGCRHDDEPRVPPERPADGRGLALTGTSRSLRFTRCLRFGLYSTIIIRNIAIGPASHPIQMMKFTKSIIPVSVAWIILISISLLWNYTNARKENFSAAGETNYHCLSLCVI